MRLFTSALQFAASPRASRRPRAVATAGASLVAALALVVGAVPGVALPTATAGSVLLGEFGEFDMTVEVNQDESELHPGGHVVYEVTAFNPAPRDKVTQHWDGTEVVTPNYSLLLAYGMMTPQGLTPQSAKGFFYPGNFGVGGTFFGGSPRDFGATSQEAIDTYALGANIATNGLRGQDSFSGQLKFGIPVTAEVGSTYDAGVFIGISSAYGGAYWRSADMLESFAVVPVPAPPKTETMTALTIGPDATAGRSVALTARVTPDVEGSIILNIEGQNYVAPVVKGIATVDHVFTSAGSFSVRAEFAPADPARYSSSNAEIVVAVESAPEATAPGSLGDTGQLVQWLSTLDLGSLTGAAAL